MLYRNAAALLALAAMAVPGESALLPSGVAPTMPQPFGVPGRRKHRRGRPLVAKHSKQKARARKKAEKAGRRAAR